MKIDTSFIFTKDTPVGKDPDAYSPTLKKYHQYLWSKPLSNGTQFDLSASHPYTYLYHNSNLGEFFLASDSAIPSFTREVKLQTVLNKINDSELKWFNEITYTIGSMIIFPGNRIQNKMTINGARGFHPRIKDRFDLTLECIKRHYSALPNPLEKVLNRYGDFFALFGDFKGYIEFFLLQDMLKPDSLNVNFFLKFDEFNRSPLPLSLAEYKYYKRNSIAFVKKRNKRIERYSNIA